MNRAKVVFGLVPFSPPDGQPMDKPMGGKWEVGSVRWWSEGANGKIPQGKTREIPVALNFLIGGEAGYIREFLVIK